MYPVYKRVWADFDVKLLILVGLAHTEGEAQAEVEKLNAKRKPDEVEYHGEVPVLYQTAKKVRIING